MEIIKHLKEAFAVFKNMGMQVIMMTGDNRLTAETIRKELNIEQAISDVLPADKEACIRSLQDKGHKVAYNILGIPVAVGILYSVFGLLLSPIIGSAAMSLSSVCVVTNALRVRWFKNEQEQNYIASHSKVEMTQGETEKLNDEIEVSNDITESKNKGQEKSKMIICNAEGMAEINEGKEIIMKKVLVVDGMMCAHCQGHVQKALEAVNGVDVSDNDLKDAVTEAGYTVLSCEEVEI